MFRGEGSHLERYAARFPVTEINSTFHRSHRSSTLERWHDAVPPSFRFSAKVPKQITHKQRLTDAEHLVDAFLEELAPLQNKLACLLVQLPPSLVFDDKIAESFFRHLRSLTALRLACEPRNESWFREEADALLCAFDVARVAADPARVASASAPGGARSFSYYRLHGSPDVYRSSYSDDFIAALATRLRTDAALERSVWCIFDNTTLGAAAHNTLALAGELGV
jgi:uncharacterized protein YecE (DUF72 family)